MASRNEIPRQSIDEESIRRQSSVSSAASDDSIQLSARARRRRTNRSSRRRTSPATRAQAAALDELLSATPEQAGPQSGSRRESASSMRTSSSIALEGPITYTPTTHRVSKAKKGKRVHACEFSGCGKVFTRAEHKRRHELNHNTEASFPCNYQGCRKAFHRPDLLHRHQGRHGSETPSREGTLHRRHGGTPGSAEVTPAIPITPMVHPHMASQTTTSYNGIPINQVLNPTTGADLRYLQASFDPFGQPFTIGYAPVFDSSEQSWIGTPDGSQSPVSEPYGGYHHRRSVSSTSSMPEVYPVAIPGMEYVPMPPVHIPSNLLAFDRSAYPPSHSEPSVPIPLSHLDGHEWLVIRRELSSSPSIFSTDDGIGIFDTVRWQNCLDCYWRHFHPFFPIVHRPTFFATKPSPLMASAMVAIGSQYDERDDAKQYSLALLEAATKLLSKRDDITSRSRLTDLQTVFLLEVLTKYRSRRASVKVSPRFRYLYASLRQARQWISTNPLHLFRELQTNPSNEDLVKAQAFWTERETRRRILQASFILDTQQAALFDQRPALMPIPLKRIQTSGTDLDLPFPCDSELWESSPIEEWVKHASDFDNVDLPTAAKQAFEAEPRRMDSFQSRLALSHILTSGTKVLDSEPNITVFRRNLETQTSFCTQFSLHALLMARNTPIRPLLIVSGETWLYGKKVDSEADFSAAKQRLRHWVNSASKCRKALWHATKLLCIVFNTLEGGGDGSGSPTFDRELNVLHEQWSLYLATLVCWAIGFDASQSTASPGVFSSNNSTISEGASHSSSSSQMSTALFNPPLVDPAEADHEMRAYLRATDLGSPEDMSSLTDDVLGRTNGLLEVVRTRRLAAPMGELLNEAERVLFRLVEGRSRLHYF